MLDTYETLDNVRKVAIFYDKRCDMSIMKQVRQYVSRLPKGKPVSTSSLMKFGTRAGVDQALSRLAKEGFITRVGRGLYFRPKVSPYVGEVPPRIMEVVKAKAGTATVQVNGAEAARKLGLSTQVPTKVVFLTNGPNRHFNVGELEIAFKRVEQRKLLLAGRQAGLALSAFWFLGKKELNSEIVEKVRNILPPEEFNALRNELPSMPIWMQNVFLENERMHLNA